MTVKPANEDDSQKESEEPVDDARAKFLAALAKKQGKQQGGVTGRGGGKSGAHGGSEGHTQRIFQRKSGAS
ncbi:hypothetical protein GALL_431610 [mine drainage metagenome]|uniref:DUF5302 domain-containing protein n=1 Tax=mine drainage metagenome TaxID=410659 RepID=A0A1J5QCF9_9ZZZZ